MNVANRFTLAGVALSMAGALLLVTDLLCDALCRITDIGSERNPSGATWREYARVVASADHTVSSLGPASAGPDAPTVLVYERLLPAVPETVRRMRHDLDETLARHGVARDRRGDIALVMTEAATNAVVHAYANSEPGPLYVGATLAGDALVLTILDSGRERVAATPSPGLGLGIALMRRLSDALRIAREGADGGTCVRATFTLPGTPVARDHASAGGDERARMLREYLRVLTANSASLHQDTRALLAQAEHIVSRARAAAAERRAR